VLPRHGRLYISLLGRVRRSGQFVWLVHLPRPAGRRDPTEQGRQEFSGAAPRYLWYMVSKEVAPLP
jgi:hypothetical protein